MSLIIVLVVLFVRDEESQHPTIAYLRHALQVLARPITVRSINFAKAAAIPRRGRMDYN